MMPRRSRNQHLPEELMEVEVSQTSAIDQSMINDPYTIIFTRCILLNRITTAEEMKALYRQVFIDDSEGQNFNQVFLEITESLKESSVKIISDKCEVTQKRYYLVIPTYFKQNQVWPNMMFKENELSFIKTVFNEIIVSDIGLISLERVVRKHEFISSKDAKKVLEKLVEENYLIEPKDGKYGLSVLARHELEPYFHCSYKDVLKTCVFCRKIMYFGGFCQSCKSDGRNSSGHFQCLKKYRESIEKKPAKCPSCHKEWSRNIIESIEELFNYEDETEDEE